MLRRSLRLNGLVAVATVAIIIGNVGFSIHNDYRGTLLDHEAMVRDLVAVVSDQARRSVRDTDLALLQLGDVVRDEGNLPAMKQRKQWEVLHRIAERVPGGLAISLADPNGDVIVDSIRANPPPVNVAERDYMKVLAAQDVLHVGPAVLSKTKPGEIVYTISRRLTDPDGEFLGVASASISTTHLTEFYDLIGFRKDPLITIFRSNGDVMARRPDIEKHVGENISGSPLFRTRIKQAPDGIFRARSPIDGIDRLFAYRVPEGTGMVALVGIPWDVVTADWRDRALVTGTVALLSIVGILLALWRGSAAIRHTIKTQAAHDEAVAAREKADESLLQAMRDHLTGLPARALFLQEADKLRLRCRTGNGRMAIMIIDLDGFKGVNDTYGHEKGDEVLVKAASILHHAIRETDVAGRLGGDEFSVCLTAPADLIDDRARMIAGRIVERMSDIGMGIGCSVGVSVCPVSCEELACALRKADEAMYEAKKLGKNRFVVWGAPKRDGTSWQARHGTCAC
jgi:diguanylate cyclase (GGDEF)-like protein